MAKRNVSAGLTALAGAVLIGALVLTDVSVGAVAPVVPGCEGLDAYRTAMVAIERDYLAAIGDAGHKDPYALSAADFQLIADQTRKEVGALNDVKPPNFAIQWHEALIARQELHVQMARAAAQRGIYAATLLKGADDYAALKVDDGLKAAAARCQDFVAFARDFTAIESPGSGTPVATPAR